MSLTRLLWVVRIMRRHSSAMTAIGFSHNTRAPGRGASTPDPASIAVGNADLCTPLLANARHWLVAQHVDPGARRLHRVLAVHRVGQREIDRVHVLTLQALQALVVVVGRRTT